MRLTSWITPQGRSHNLLVGSSILWIPLCLSGCSVYQSQGRKNFENYAPGRVQTNVGVSAIIAGAEPKKLITSTTCWTQPRHQALWNHGEAGSTLVVQNINDDQITVCLGWPDETDKTTQ